MNHQRFEFRPLSDADLPLLADWLARPHLQEWWRDGEITIESIREKYLPNIIGDDVRPFIVYSDNFPFGYIQYYDASKGNPDWWPDKPGEGVVGIDQFIADESLLNKGIGTRMISQFVQHLMNDLSITEIRVDPGPDNLRAIRCYEKVGFRTAGEIITPDGPAMMMIFHR